MKRAVAIACACLIAGVALAQTTVDPAKVVPSLLDFSKARVSIAGPDKVYIRSVYYGADQVSVLLQYDGKAGADVVGIYTADDKVIPDSYVAEYASVEGVAPDAIRISGVIAGGEAYAATLKWVPDTSSLALSGALEQVQAPDTVEDLRGHLAEQKKANDGLAQQVADLQRRVAAAPTVAATAAAPVVAAPAAAPAKPARVVLSGFPGTSQLLGTWKVSGSVVSQQDASVLFAKAAVPLRQDQPETLYELTAKAKEAAWVGYGLHFFASGDATLTGYGFGSSFLVWLTSDSIYYKTGVTYVQLYRSYDDVKMIQLASVAIPESIGAELKTEVLYNASARTISVSVNGAERLRYQVGEALTVGDKVALRALGGPVDFSAFAVRVR